MNLNKIVLVILLGASSAFGQDIGTTEVKVVEGFKPVIPGASRLNENATFECQLHGGKAKFTIKPK